MSGDFPQVLAALADRGAHMTSMPGDSPGFLLWHVTLRWQREVTAVLKPLGLTHVQFVLLASTWWLNDQGEQPSQVALAAQAGTDVKMTSQVVRTLERKGLLVCEADAADTRARRLVATADGEQKGVDLRIGLDLVAHARNGAIDAMYLVSGDDDLAEAVEEAQAQGAQVTLLAVPTAGGGAHGMSKHLHRSSDGLDLIATTTLDAAVTRATRTDTAAAISHPAATPSPPHPAPVRLVPSPALLATWMATASPEQRSQLTAGRPSIPRDLDRALLLDASAALNIYDLDEVIRQQLRARFWQNIDDSDHS